MARRRGPMRALRWFVVAAVLGAMLLPASPALADSFNLAFGLSTQTPPGSGTIVSRDGGINCVVTRGIESGSCGATYPAGTVVTFDVVASTDSLACKEGASCYARIDGETVTVDQAKVIVTYGFKQHYWSLEVSHLGPGVGTVTSSPLGINCGSSCQSYFFVNSNVTVTAVPAPGSTFIGWDNEGPCAGSGPSCTFQLIEDTVVYALYGIATPAPPTPVPTPSPVPSPSRVSATRAPASPLTASPSPSPGEVSASVSPGEASASPSPDTGSPPPITTEASTAVSATPSDGASPPVVIVGSAGPEPWRIIVAAIAFLLAGGVAVATYWWWRHRQA
jgi:hypothetical protein